MPIDPVGYTCVCKRHNGGHPHAVSRSAWYKHLRAAETEEERDTIRAGNLSLDLHAQIRAHADALGESSSSAGPSRNVATDTGSRPPERLDEAAQGSHVREYQLPTPSSPHGEQRRLVDEDPIIPMGDEDRDFNMQDDGNLDGSGDGDIGGQRDGNLDGWGDDGRRDEGVHGQMLPAPQHADRREQPAIDIEELAQRAVLPKIKMTMEFILALRSASLGDPVAKLDEEARSNLRNPPREPPDIIDPIIRHSISTYYALEHSSQSAYERIRSSTARTFPDTDEMPSFYRIERMIAEYTGVESITHDMCPDTCIAFTGPFSDLDRCPVCHKHRYDQIKLQASRGRNKVARKFHTIPAGPQLQALYRDRDSAKRMRYRADRTAKLFDELRESGGLIDVYDDFVMGSDYLNAVLEGKISENDIILMISMDGAQLYQSKLSDCWLYIWVVMDHAPDVRYKKKHVLPGGFIPGPNKPKNIDSFLFPGLHHLAALQNEGLSVYDAWRDIVFLSHPYLFLATADGPGLVYFDGMVGHCGKNGCRLYCGVIGRRKERGTHYYPVLLRPNNFHVAGCDHPDVDVFNLPLAASQNYATNLLHLVSSPNQRQYDKRKTETGITKPSILLGLNPSHMLRVPVCFSTDVMHLAGLLSDLLLSLWRGTIDCAASDDVELWEWRVMHGDVWEAHGQAVAAAGQYLPGSFDRKPRNIAEKINTGYKTWEFQLYLFGLAPALTYGLLPEPYWLNYCRLVAGFRIICQHRITRSDLQRAQVILGEWELEFEELYYQRRQDRIHFIRPCAHQVNHLVSEAIQKGPPVCYAQWTMERTIGNLGQEIRQPSEPYANLSREGVRRSQVNALKAMLPELDEPPKGLPSGAIDLGEGYALLRKRDRRSAYPQGAEKHAITLFLNEPAPEIFKWARLKLPNGQIARSLWRESLKSMDATKPLRVSRNVKFSLDGVIRFGEVRYFTQLATETIGSDDGETEWSFVNVAVVSLFSLPDKELLELSSHVVASCTNHGDNDIRVIDAKSITDVVAMVPHRPRLPSGVIEDRFFMVEKPGLDVASFGILPADDAVEGEDSDNDSDDAMDGL